MTDIQMTDEEIRSIEFEIKGETFRSGTSKGRRLVPEVTPPSEEAQHWVDIAGTVIKLLRTGAGIQHRLDNEGDKMTLGELLDRNDLSVDDLRRESRLSNIDPLEYFSVGDVVTLQEELNGEPQPPKRGVVSELRSDDILSDVAKVKWLGGGVGYYESNIENKDGKVRVGRVPMMGRVYDVKIEDLDSVTDEEILELRESIFESIDVDEKAATLTVEIEKKWESSAAIEDSNAKDHHAELTVSGDLLEESVTVSCRNIFDAGWVANVEANLDDDLEAVVLRAARNNSPIPTGIRL